MKSCSFSRHWKIIACICIAGAIPACTPPTDNHTAEVAVPMLVSASWLDEHMADPELVVIHIGEQAGYDEGHIAGSRYLDRETLLMTSARGLHNELPSVAHLDSVFEGLGISNQSHVVLYHAERALSMATRTFFTLDYIGLGNRTSILNGGLAAWLDAGGAITTEIPVVSNGDLTPIVNSEIVAFADWLHGNLASPTLSVFDARGAASYSGERAGSYPRPGHIAGASNLPFSTLLIEETTAFLDTDSLQGVFASAGVASGDSVVAYCGSGMAGSAVYFISRFLGYEAMLYDASFEEWSARGDLPVESIEP